MITFEDNVNRLIGLPYDAYKAHCWHLVEELIPTAPKLEGTAKSLTASVRHFESELHKHTLTEVKDENYKDRDIVILGRNNIYFHAGVYYDGGVIHASREGVVYQSMSSIKLLYTNIQGLRT